MADSTARPVESAPVADRQAQLGLAAWREARSAVPAPIVAWQPTPLLSPSSDFLGIAPPGWAGAAIMIAAIALASTAVTSREALPETKPVVVGVVLETPPPPPAPALPEPIAPLAPSAEPPAEAVPSTPEGAAPMPEAGEPLPVPSEVTAASPPIIAAPLEALPPAPPPKPSGPAPRHRAAAAATRLPLAAPAQDAALPIVPPRPIGGMTDNGVANYPGQANAHRFESEVVLRVAVSATGDLISVTIARSSGNEILDQAALLVVRHWRFSPATRGGEPIAGTAEVPIWSRIDN